jgi:arabinosaccharide transport system substrate-binding protein
MYWNMAELEKYGITKDDVDAVTTWDDYTALGKKYVAARGEDGKVLHIR